MVLYTVSQWRSVGGAGGGGPFGPGVHRVLPGPPRFFLQNCTSGAPPQTILPPPPLLSPYATAVYTASASAMLVLMPAWHAIH